MKNMRIAYIVNQYPKVSHSFIRREIRALEQLGADITRISIRGKDDSLYDPEDLAEQKITNYVLRDGAPALIISLIRAMWIRPLRLSKALALAIRMARLSDRPLFIHLIYVVEACHILPLLQRRGITHVHAHFGTNPAEVAMLCHVLGGPQWSFTVHGPEEFDRPRAIGLAEKIRRCCFVVAVSSFGRSQLFRYCEHRFWQKVHVVHCGLEPRFYCDVGDTPPTSRTLVCVGRLCEQKGQLLLVEAAKILFQRGIKFNLVLAGDGDDRFAIEGLVKDYALESAIRITGWITGAQVREEILSARALVLPSFAEGLPVVIMEAMALKRPVISTYVAGIPELVISGQSGWLVPAGDENALADAMLECLDAPTSQITSLANIGFSRVTLRHVIDIEAAKLAKLFRVAIDERPSSAYRREG